MSDRLTNKWTATSEEAFGASGAKGDRGEEFLMEVFASWGWRATRHQSSKTDQISGVDITFQKPTWLNSYTCDVKANLNDSGSFFVETNQYGWLFNPKKTSHRIWHVNPETGWMAWYDRREMQRYIVSRKLNTGKLVRFSIHDKLPFIKSQQATIVVNPTKSFDDVPF